MFAEMENGSLFNGVTLISALASSAVLAAVVLFTFVWPWRAPRTTRLALGWTLGIGLDFAVGCVLLGVQLQWPPVVDQQRFLLILLPAVILIETVGVWERIPRWLIWTIRLILAACVPTILLWGTTYLVDYGFGLSKWTPTERYFWLTGLVLVLSLVWGLMVLLARRSQDRNVPILLTLVCLGSAVTVMLSGYATAGLMMFPLVAALAGAVLASFFLSGSQPHTGTIGIAVVSLFSLVMLGHFFGTMSLEHALVLVLLPLLGWVGEIRWISDRQENQFSLKPDAPEKDFSPSLRWHVRLQSIGALVVVLLSLALVILQSWQQFQHDSQVPSAIPVTTQPPSYLDSLSREEINDEYKEFMKTNPETEQENTPSSGDLFGNSP